MVGIVNVVEIVGKQFVHNPCCADVPASSEFYFDSQSERHVCRKMCVREVVGGESYAGEHVWCYYRGIFFVFARAVVPKVERIECAHIDEIGIGALAFDGFDAGVATVDFDAEFVMPRVFVFQKTAERRSYFGEWHGVDIAQIECAASVQSELDVVFHEVGVALCRYRRCEAQNQHCKYCV